MATTRPNVPGVASWRLSVNVRCCPQNRSRTRHPVLLSQGLDTAIDVCVYVGRSDLGLIALVRCVAFGGCRNKKAKEPKVKDEEKTKKKSKKSGKSKKKEQSA